MGSYLSCPYPEATQVTLVHVSAQFVAAVTWLSCFRLGERGTTVIFSIHQPRYSIYKMFTNLTLLSLGRVVYGGPAPEALDFFSSIGE